MKIIFSSLILLLSSQLFAQSELEKVNHDVWYNFMQAYQDLDASLFNQIHTDDVLRVSLDNENLLIGQEYKDLNLENFNSWNQAGVKQKIEFSFHNRVHKNGWGYETGIYKLTRYYAGQSRSKYGKFNVTLKKVNGFWKIKVDADTNEGRTLNESHFQNGNILK